MTQVSQTTRRRSEHGADSQGEDTPAGQSGSLLADLRGSGAVEGPSDAPALPGRVRRPFPTQHLVTLLVVVAGGGALVAMRQYGMGAGMKFDKAAKVDFVETVSMKRTPEQERILTDLQRGVTAAPPQAADIQKNPFKLVQGQAPAIEAVGPDPDADAKRTAEERKRRESEINSALAAVTLNGVMGGAVPLARVNGEIVRVGDKVSNLFIVAAIQGRSILLTADGQAFIVEMSQEPDQRPQPKIRPRSGK